MANMIPISTVTVGSTSVAAISFTGIPQIYTDLLVKISGRSAGGGSPQVRMTINGSGASVYSYRNLYGDGSNAGSSTESSITDIFLGLADGTAQTSNTFTNQEIYIPNYTSSNNKSISSDSVMENNATLSYQNLVAGLFASTNPISSLSFTMGNNFVQHSSATLYGIRKY